MMIFVFRLVEKILLFGQMLLRILVPFFSAEEDIYAQAVEFGSNSLDGVMGSVRLVVEQSLKQSTSDKGGRRLASR
jgi:hypothetical protein